MGITTTAHAEGSTREFEEELRDPEWGSNEIWHSLDAERSLSALRATERGLTDDEAEHRLGIFGRNVLQEAQTTPA